MGFKVFSLRLLHKNIFHTYFENTEQEERNNYNCYVDLCMIIIAIIIFIFVIFIFVSNYVLLGLT